MAILKIIWRRRNLVLGNILLWALFAGATTAFHEPCYTASAYIFPYSQGAEFSAAISNLDRGTIAKAVIDRLGLLNTPEYNLSIIDNASITAKFLQNAENLGYKLQNTGGYAQEKFEENISIEAVGGSFAFKISTISIDPSRAANISNATKDTIIEFLTSPSTEQATFTKRDIWVENAQTTYIPSPPAFSKIFLRGSIFGLFIGIFTSILRDKLLSIKNLSRRQ